MLFRSIFRWLFIPEHRFCIHVKSSVFPDSPVPFSPQKAASAGAAFFRTAPGRFPLSPHFSPERSHAPDTDILSFLVSASALPPGTVYAAVFDKLIFEKVLQIQRKRSINAALSP